MSRSTRTTPLAAASAVAIVAGALVAVALGVYGSIHEPTGRDTFTLGFGSVVAMKVWLALVAGVLGLVQLVTALWLYGRLGRPAAPWVSTVHHANGALVVLLTLPVAYNCLWSFGFQAHDTRTLVHSLLGCLLYGALVTKLVVLHGPATSGWLLPAAAGLLFTVLVVVVLTSSLWYLVEVGLPSAGGY